MKTTTLCFIIMSALFISDAVFSQDSLTFVTRIAGDSTEDRFYKVTDAGDVNGDGFGDLLVGSNGGYAKLFLGGKEINPEGDLVFSITEDDDDYAYYFGTTVAGGGDLNGDGYDDFVISWPGYSNIIYEGRIYIYFGGAVVDTIPDLIIEREYFYWNYPNFGFDMVLDGDINGDGYDDLIASANRDYHLKGKVYIYFGGEDMNSVRDILIEGADNDQIGSEISYVGDFNNDNFDDFVVSSFRGEGLGGITVCFYLFWGEKNISEVGWENSEQFIIDGERPIKGITGLRDINNDGNLDFAVINSDSLFIYSYDFIENQVDLITFSSDTTQQGFRALSNSNHLNNDNYNDFVIGVARWPTFPQGAAHIIYGQNNTVIAISDTIVTADSISDFGEGTMAIIHNFFGENRNLLVIGYTWIDNVGTMGFLDFYTNACTTDITHDKNNKLIRNFRMFENYPNPFNPTTTIKYSIPKKGDVKLKIFNILGELITTLINKNQKKGNYKITFDAGNLTSGVYIVSAQFKQQIISKKIMLLK